MLEIDQRRAVAKLLGWADGSIPVSSRDMDLPDLGVLTAYRLVANLQQGSLAAYTKYVLVLKQLMPGYGTLHLDAVDAPPEIRIRAVLTVLGYWKDEGVSRPPLNKPVPDGN